MYPKPPHEQGDNKNLMIAIGLCVAIMIGAEFVLPRPEVVPVAPAETAENTAIMPAAPEAGGTPAMQIQPKAPELAAVETAEIENGAWSGRIATKGGRIDQLSLPQFTQEISGDDHVEIFRSKGDQAHFFDAGWLGSGVWGPDGNTTWDLVSDSETEKVLEWQNTSGQTFRRVFTFAPDAYAVTITDSVENTAQLPVVLSHYAQLHKTGVDFSESTWVNFMGPMGVADDLLVEAAYDDLQEKQERYEAREGWIGMTQRYFMAAIVPDQKEVNTLIFQSSKANNKEFFSTVLQSRQQTVAPGQKIARTYKLYVGPKSVDYLAPYNAHLYEAVDYGWFHAIAAPLHWLLMYIHGFVGNIGWAVVLATVLLKIALYPLATKSYVSMARMRKMQPEMEKLKAEHGDNRERMAMEMMALYKKYKVNPASGCWPMLLQIPIFFAYYKVILISFEFRQAEFIFWLTDLSVKDPFYVLPILMGISMFVQFRLTPQSADPVQAKVMQAMPIVFTFLFLMFPAGLVLYWLTNNVISIAQQWFITKKVEYDEAHSG